MLRKFAAALVATALIAGPAFRADRRAPPAQRRLRPRPSPRLLRRKPQSRRPTSMAARRCDQRQADRKSEQDGEAREAAQEDRQARREPLPRQVRQGASGAAREVREDASGQYRHVREAVVIRRGLLAIRNMHPTTGCEPRPGSCAPTCGSRRQTPVSPASRNYRHGPKIVLTEVVPAGMVSRSPRSVPNEKRKIARIREAGCNSRPPIFLAIQFRLPLDRHMLVAGRGLDQMAAGREGEVIAGHQHAVSGGAIEDSFPRGDGGGSVDIEGGLPVGMAREHRRMLRGVAQDQERLIAGVNGEHGVARRVAGRRQRFDAGRDFLARFELRHLRWRCRQKCAADCGR